MTFERSISVLGLGLMGSALVRVLLQHGWKVTVWNRTFAKTQPLSAAGAIAVTSPGECIAASPLVITCFIDPEAFYDVFEGISPRACNSRILVDYTAGIPSDIQRCQEKASKLSFLAYIRGAIMTTPPHVGSAESVFYYSGNEKAFRSIEAALKVLGNPIYLGHDVTSATLQECILGNCFYGFAAGFLQSMAVLKSSKLYSPGGAQLLMSEAIVPTLTHHFPNIFADLARQIDDKDYVTKGDGARLDTLSKALDNMIKATNELGLSSILLEPMRKLIQVRIAEGGAAEEMSSLVETLSHHTRVSEFS